MFSAWSKSLRRGGILYLEHTPENEFVDYLDTFGASTGALRRLVEHEGLVYMEMLECFTPDKQRRVLSFLKP